jgi:hypothetical protein
MPESFVARLVRDLRRRADELDAERAAIDRALRVLDIQEPQQHPRELRVALIESLAAAPGTRASFLALGFNVSAAAVKAELHELEKSGAVVKSGLGWRLA